MTAPQDPNIDSFPSYFKLTVPPFILNSPFPPLKMEYRYRGVYERAGFEVNDSSKPSTPNLSFSPSDMSSKINSSLTTRISTPRRVSNPPSVSGNSRATKLAFNPMHSYLSSAQAGQYHREGAYQVSEQFHSIISESPSNQDRTDSTSPSDSDGKNLSASLMATSASLVYYLNDKLILASIDNSADFMFNNIEGPSPCNSFAGLSIIDSPANLSRDGEFGMISNIQEQAYAGARQNDMKHGYGSNRPVTTFSGVPDEITIRPVSISFKRTICDRIESIVSKLYPYYSVRVCRRFGKARATTSMLAKPCQP